MPTIEISNAFDATTKRLLNETFEIVIRKLDLNEDFTVKVELVGPIPDSFYARVREAEEKLFHMEINSYKLNLFDLTASFGHELIHVQQHIKGWLRVKETGSLLTDGIYWKDQFYPAITLMLNNGSNCVPWEIDAWKRMGELHKYVVAHLPPADAALIDISKSVGLNKTWNADFAPWEDCGDIEV